jgi:TRAP-type C4-dicarboxylate transport system substrate-binding protein
MNMNTFIAVGAAALIGSSGALAQQPVKLRFSSIEPPMAPITARVLTPWAKEVSAASGGTLEIEMYAGGTLGRSIAQQVKLVQDGVADITWTAPAMTPGRFGGVEVVELPFVIQSVREGGLALWRLYEQGLLTGFGEFKVLLLGTTSPQFLNSLAPINTLADLKGRRVSGLGPIRTKTLDSLGAVPVPVAPPQVAEALSKGVVDAIISEWNFNVTFKVDEVASNFYEMPLGCDALMVIMLKSKFDALPAPARAAIDKHSGEALVRRLIELFESSDAAVRERVSKQTKKRITTPTTETIAIWRKMTDPVIEGWRKESAQNDRLFQGLDAEIKKVRAAR